MIPFNKPLVTNKEFMYLQEALRNAKLAGDGSFTKKCSDWIQKELNCQKVLLTTSCTHALEMAAILCDIRIGDEVIMPSFTFPSTANAFALRGAKIIFVDINPDTMNIDEAIVGKAISPKTKAIVVVHYAGMSCAMDDIMRVASKHGLYVIEDAAQAYLSTFNDKYLGTIGDIGCLSFHETKNVTCGEGGAILVNNSDMVERAEIIREKGTNRAQFFRGEVDKYSWVDLGSSYLPSELNAAFLLAQLESAKEITRKRLELWQLYYERLKPLHDEGVCFLPKIPSKCSHNGHIFYMKLKDENTRNVLMNYLRSKDVMSIFHYVPLHSSAAGNKYGSFFGTDRYTTAESGKLLRLPLYYDLNQTRFV